MVSPVTARIRDLLRRRGPVTFADFMALALYEPGLGYYARASQRSGRAGDFFTSVDLGPLFGQLLAEAITDMWRVLGSPAELHLVEAGAGNGRLSRDVLEALDQAGLKPCPTAEVPGRATGEVADRPTAGVAGRPTAEGAGCATAEGAGPAAPDESHRLYGAIRLHLVEATAAAREAQISTLGRHGAKLASSSPVLWKVTDAVLFANELLDALPAHAVVMREDGLREVYVTVDGDRLVERDGPLSTPRLADYLARAGARLEPGWRAEVNLAAEDWVAEAASSIDRGFLLLIDYGHPASELFSAAYARGTLASYRGHVSDREEAGRAPWLDQAGECDITSHVDLTSIVRAGERAGLELLALTDQTYFLLGLGAAERLEESTGDAATDLARRLALKTLVMPGGLGSTLKVMIFGKHVGRPALRSTSFGTRLT